MAGWRDPQGLLHLNPNAMNWPKNWSSNPDDHPPFKLDARVMVDKLPGLARQLGIAVDDLLYDAAFHMVDTWQEKVRVDTGQYRDSIAIDPNSSSRGIGMSSFHVSSDIPWSVWNEYGSKTISADHAAERSADETEEWLRQNIEQAILDALDKL
jgi:hypothetical protein